MRVVVDTNLLINYLLSPTRASSASAVIFQAALDGHFTLLLPVAVVAEFNRKVRDDPTLKTRIGHQDSAELITLLTSVAEIVPYLPEPYPPVGRDRNDDFLIAHCVVAKADYLVTRDKDLLDLSEVDGIRITTPPVFLTTLRTAGIL